jgi:hypothetical protein
MRYQVGSNELKFEVYRSSDSIWNEGDDVCVDFATDAASILRANLNEHDVTIACHASLLVVSIALRTQGDDRRA